MNVHIPSEIATPINDQQSLPLCMHTITSTLFELEKVLRIEVPDKRGPGFNLDHQRDYPSIHPKQGYTSLCVCTCLIQL